MSHVHDVYYFGCWGDSGHCLFTQSGRSCYASNGILPTELQILDGHFCADPAERNRLGRHEGPQYQGIARIVHVAGWTVLAFWDRSYDKRGNSNSAFLCRGTFTFSQMCEIAAARFPVVWGRITTAFPVVSADGAHLVGVTPENLAEWEALNTKASIPVMAAALRRAWAEIERLRGGGLDMNSYPPALQREVDDAITHDAAFREWHAGAIHPHARIEAALQIYRAKLVKPARRRIGLTQAQAAERMGVTAAVLVAMENGHRGTTLDQLNRLRDGLLHRASFPRSSTRGESG